MTVKLKLDIFIEKIWKIQKNTMQAIKMTHNPIIWL